jgi:hypothetical protein
MPLQDEMTFQRIEVLLDMQAKKITAELAKLREELSQVKEELRKEIHAGRQDTHDQQAGPARVQMYADVPPHQEAAPVPRYAQQQEAPRYAQEQPHHEQHAPQGYVQAPPQQQGGYGQPVYADAMPTGQRAREKAPETRPIDRNGVAPADVSVEKFFNFSNKPVGSKK